jgi:hypothetical protein
LRRRQPDLVTGLTALYPNLESALEGRRPLGPEVAAEAAQDAGATAAATEIAKAALVEARKDLNEVLAVLTRRTRTLARLRLAGGVITSISSAGVIAALIGSNFTAQISSAMVAFASSMLALVAGYIEDFSGGDGSVRRLREQMTTQVRRLAEIGGEIKVALAQSDTAKIFSALTEISAVLGEVQYARAQLGLSI